jgi:hypothetical protein
MTSAELDRMFQTAARKLGEDLTGVQEPFSKSGETSNQVDASRNLEEVPPVLLPSPKASISNSR